MEPTTRRTSEALALLFWLAGQVSHATPSAKDSVNAGKESLEILCTAHVPLVACYIIIDVHIYMNLLKLADVH